jgi:hypothetical protein
MGRYMNSTAANSICATRAVQLSCFAEVHTMPWLHSVQVPCTRCCQLDNPLHTRKQANEMLPATHSGCAVLSHHMCCMKRVTQHRQLHSTHTQCVTTPPTPALLYSCLRSRISCQACNAYTHSFTAVSDDHDIVILQANVMTTAYQHS